MGIQAHLPCYPKTKWLCSEITKHPKMFMITIYFHTAAHRKYLLNGFFPFLFGFMGRLLKLFSREKNIILKLDVNVMCKNKIICINHTSNLTFCLKSSLCVYETPVSLFLCLFVSFHSVLFCSFYLVLFWIFEYSQTSNWIS